MRKGMRQSVGLRAAAALIDLVLLGAFSLINDGGHSGLWVNVGILAWGCALTIGMLRVRQGSKWLRLVPAMLLGTAVCVGLAFAAGSWGLAGVAVWGVPVLGTLLAGLDLGDRGQTAGQAALLAGGTLLMWFDGAAVRQKCLLTVVLAVDRGAALIFRRNTDEPAAWRDELKKLHDAYAGRAFMRMLAAGGAFAALLVSGFWVTVMGASVQVSRLLLFLGAGAGGVCVCLVLEKLRGKGFDPTHQAILGWLLGLLAVVLWPTEQWGNEILFSLLCGAACSQLMLAMVRAIGVMRDACRFILGSAAGVNRGVKELVCDAAVLGLAAGVMVSVAAMLLHAWRWIALPVSLVCLAAIFGFPMSGRWTGKVRRWLEMTAEGRETAERTRQLEAHIVRRSLQPFLLDFLVGLAHLVYSHRTEGVENVHPDEDNPIVYLCNHGDLYGPIASWLTIPTEKRPWTISYISSDVPTAAAYLYKYDWSVKTWMPDWMRHTMANIVGWFAVWATRDLLDSVPVWRDSPRQLMNTFRQSVEALVCGDNLLIFPENPNAAGVDHGYETEGIGELFSGFAMLGQIYYNKTGKRCRFVPLFAHQRTRSVCFGTEIVYDPDNDPRDERERISDETARQMLDMYHRMNGKGKE